MKIIVKHMTGSKANQIEIFELPVKEIIIGREEGCQVVYDSVKDDQVSPRHLKITQDKNDQFQITDLFSSNGTLVNDQAVVVPVSLQAGDIVQLGKSGPKFEFDLDPRPQTSIKATRLESSISIPIPTREIPADNSSQTKSTAKVADDTRHGSTSSSPGTRKRMINIGAGILTLVLGSSGYLYIQNNLDKKELETDISTTRSNQAAQIIKNQPVEAASDTSIASKKITEVKDLSSLPESIEEQSHRESELGLVPEKKPIEIAPSIKQAKESRKPASPQQRDDKKVSRTIEEPSSEGDPQIDKWAEEFFGK